MNKIWFFYHINDQDIYIHKKAEKTHFFHLHTQISNTLFMGSPHSTTMEQKTEKKPLSPEELKQTVITAIDELHLRLSSSDVTSLKTRLTDVPQEIYTTDELHTFLVSIQFFETEYFKYLVKTGITIAETGGRLMQQVATDPDLEKTVSEILFTEFNSDHNDHLDANELIRGLLIYAVKSTTELIQLRFHAYDKDNSNTLTSTEIRALLQNHIAETVKMLKISIKIAAEYAMDQCDDSEKKRIKYRKKISTVLDKFDVDCHTEMLNHYDQIQSKWLELIDVDHDGVISFEEFQKAFDDKITLQMTDFMKTIVQPKFIEYFMECMTCFG